MKYGVDCVTTLTISDIQQLYFNARLKVPVITISLDKGKNKKRKLVNLQDIGNKYDFNVHNNSIGNLVCGIFERMYVCQDKITSNFYVPPKPQPRAFQYLCKPFTSRMRRASFYVPKIGLDDFLSWYSGPKRARYQRAALKTLSILISNKLAYCNTFVKGEKFNATKKPRTVPRVIQPRSYEYNYLIGCYLKPMEKVIFKQINKIFGDGITVFKGLNAEQRGREMRRKWDRFDNPVAIGVDAKRFDQHVSRDALLYEHSIYAMFNNSLTFLQYLSWQISNVGFARCEGGNIKYNLDGGRMSGDMNTSLGNIILMCAMMFSFLFKKFGMDFEFINDGDDCVIIIEKRNLSKFYVGFTRFFLRLGFEMEVEDPVYEFEHIEFCQSKPCYVDGSWRMTRIPETAIAKDMLNLNNMRDRKDWAAQCKANAGCGLALVGNMPVMKSFYQMLDRVEHVNRVAEEEINGKWFLSRGMEYVEGEISAESRYSFYKMSGMTPDEQVALENIFDSKEFHYETPVPRDEFVKRDELILLKNNNS